MITFQQLRDLNTSALNDAVFAWTNAGNELGYLADRYETEVKTALREVWVASAEQAAEAGMAEIASEMRLAAREASALARGISDARNELWGAQKDLNDVLEEIKQTPGFWVDPNGTVFWELPPKAPLTDHEIYTAMSTAFANRISAAIVRAMKADQDASWDLYADVTAIPNAFNRHPTEGRDGNMGDVVDKYRVQDDPGGMTKFPSGYFKYLAELAGMKPVPMTQTEAKMLENLSLRQLKAFNRIRDLAFSESEIRFPGADGEDNHQDAFRHAYWNALMTQKYGVDWTTKFATAHEGTSGNLANREAMDLYNNEVGRRVAMENPNASPEELAAKVEAAVRNGDMAVIDRNHQVVRSNQEEIGVNVEAETGKDELPPGDGGAVPTGPNRPDPYDPDPANPGTY